MKLKIVKIIDRGIAGKERLWMKAIQDTEMDYYIVFDTTYISQDSISTAQQNTYWFEGKKVKSGDSIVLYTKKGTPSSKGHEDGTTTHFFYWGLDKPIWKNKGGCAVLFEVSGWVTSPYE